MMNVNQIINNVITLVVFFALLFGFSKIIGPIPFDVTNITTQKSEAFSVTGEGKVSVKPDSATVRLGVTANAPTADTARLQINTNMNQVLDAIKALGVEESNIKTENFNVYPQYSDGRVLNGSGDAQSITGYIANTNLVITLNDPDKANKVIDAGVAAGANLVGGVNFEVKDKGEALNQAREMAVADAKKKAEDAAKIAGFKLGRIINYSEGQSGGYPVPMLAKAQDAQGGSETNIQSGENEISLNVTLSYEIK